MSDKVYLTAAQSEEIKTLLKESPAEDIIHDHTHGEWWDESPLNGLPLDTLIRALYIGYEVDKTPEDKILDEYLRRDTGDQTDMAYQNGMEFVLCTLGIIIKRIND